MSKEKETPSVSFEASIRRLEEIVRKMEAGDLPLDEALALFEEGTGLVKTANGLLDQAKLKVSQLLAGSADQAPRETEFEHED